MKSCSAFLVGTAASKDSLPPYAVTRWPATHEFSWKRPKKCERREVRWIAYLLQHTLDGALDVVIARHIAE